MKKEELVRLFKAPGNEWRGKPFWSWNGELRKEELARQIDVMQKMGMGGYFMHSRSGLITEYLGDEWFDCINFGADEGEKKGMEAWLYDEDRWPSGSAGGKVTEDESLRAQSLQLREEDRAAFEWKEEKIAVFAAKLDGLVLNGYRAAESIAELALAFADLADTPGEAKVLSFTVVRDKPDSNYNGNTYIDTLKREATERFIELTHEEYRRRGEGRIGKNIRGIFTDEPHNGHAMDDLCEKDGVLTCSICWTDDFFEEFEKRYGYDARPLLPELFYRYKGEKMAPVKHDWFDLADELFLERYADPIKEWCEKNGMIFTGHVLHEDSLSNQSVPEGSLMRFYPHMGYPGVDVLGEGNRCYWIVKQLTSVTRQTGQKWLLSELYGCTGWQMDFKGHKAVGDWQALFGINLRCPHLSWYTMEGQAKRDYPGSILHQSTFWPYYGVVETYFARFGAFLTEGKPVCDVLVLNPVESAWSQAYRGWSRWIFSSDPGVHALEQKYAELFTFLTGHHIDFDYGEEKMMKDTAFLGKDALGRPVIKMGLAEYRCVVVGGAETVRSETLALLKDFASQGGSVIFVGDEPKYVDAKPSGEVRKFAEACVRCPWDAGALARAVRKASDTCLSVKDALGHTAASVFVQERVYEDGRGFVLLNTDREHESGELTVTLKGDHPFAEEWLLREGERRNAEALCTREGELVRVTVSLPAGGTRAFFFADEKDESLPPVPEKGNVVREETVTGSFDFSRSESNVCVLDFARASLDNGEWTEEKEILHTDDALRDRLGLERRGGSMLQPWFAKKFDQKTYGTLKLEYAFDIETLPEGPVFLAGERPEKMHYAVNGTPLEIPSVNDFWIDEAFKKMPVPAGLLKIGRNVVTAETEFKRTSNSEPLYLVGEFGVRLEGKKRTLTGLPEKIGNGELSEYGLPFYTGEISYEITPEQYANRFEKDARVILSPVSFSGSLLLIGAKGEEKTVVPWEPCEADVTDLVRAGKTIAVTVVPSRRNLFGPLHLLPVFQDSYGPASFVTGGSGWSDDYCLIPSAMTGIKLKSVR